MVYVASRKAAAMLGLHPQTLRRYANEGIIPHYRNSAGQRLYDVDAYLRGSNPAYRRVLLPGQFRPAARRPQPTGRPDATTLPRRRNRYRRGRRAQPGNAKDCSPYWTDCIGAISSTLWLPTGTDWPGSALNSSSGWSSRTAAQSWFSISQMPAPSPNSPRIYSPTSIRSVAGCTDSDATERQSRRIRVYPNQQQKARIATWLDASRWTYNLTVEVLQSGIPAVWRHIAGMVMAELKVLHPEWESVPYQVKRTAVRDACRAMSNVKHLQPAAGSGSKPSANGQDEDHSAQLRFRSRKNPRQIMLHTG